MGRQSASCVFIACRNVEKAGVPFELTSSLAHISIMANSTSLARNSCVLLGVADCDLTRGWKGGSVENLDCDEAKSLLILWFRFHLYCA